MKILIINLHSAHNAGDHVLLQVGLQELYRQFPGGEITLAMNDPASYAGHADAGDERVVDSFFAWIRSASTSTNTTPKWQVRLRLLTSLALSLLLALAHRLLGVKWLWLLPPRYRASVAAYLDADMVVSCAGNFLYSRAHGYGLPLLGQVFADPLRLAGGETALYVAADGRAALAQVGTLAYPLVAAAHARHPAP